VPFFAAVTLTLTRRGLGDLDILKMYIYTENGVSRSKLSKFRAREGQTDRQTDTDVHCTRAPLC